MARGYGNRERYDRQLSQTMAASAQVGVASASAAATEAIESVAAGVPPDLAAKLLEFEGRISALEPA